MLLSVYQYKIYIGVSQKTMRCSSIRRGCLCGTQDIVVATARFIWATSRSRRNMP